MSYAWCFYGDERRKSLKVSGEDGLLLKKLVPAIRSSELVLSGICDRCLRPTMGSNYASGQLPAHEISGDTMVSCLAAGTIANSA